MTNSNDFRRYSYSADPTYLISQFDYQRGSQAPKVKPVARPKKGFKVRENASVKTKNELVAEQRQSRKAMVIIGAVAVVCLIMVGLVINSLAVKNQLTKDIAKQEVAIANAQSENISLQSRLDALVSMSMIDEYAVDELGMTKVKSNQIQYVDVDDFRAQYQQQLEEKQAAESAETAAKADSGNN